MRDNPDIAAVVVVVPDVVPGSAKCVLEVVGCFAAAEGTCIGAGTTVTLHEAHIGNAATSNLSVDLKKGQN